MLSYIRNLAFICSKHCHRRNPKKFSMVRPSRSAWRSLRTINTFMLTNDSSLEVSFLEHKGMLLVYAAEAPCCHTGQCPSILMSASTFLYYKSPTFQDFI